MANSTASAPMDTTVFTGPTIVGSTLNWYLHGVLTVQYVLYLMYSPHDKKTIKFIVHLIFALDTVQTILTMDDIFFWFVHNFGDIAKFFEFRWAFDIPTFDAIIGFIVQSVYCWRIWVLSGWRILPILTTVVALLAGASGFACGVRFQVQDGPSLAHGFNVAMMLWLFGSAVTDVVIACSMTYVLWRVRRDSTRVRSSAGAKIMRLMTLTLETNAVTAAVAIVTVVLFLAKPVAPPATNFYQLGGYLLGKLYSNCFMILLNQRHARSSDSKGGPSAGSYQHSRSNDIELGSRSAGLSRTMVTTTVTVDDGKKSKVNDFSEDGTYKSKISLGI